MNSKTFADLILKARRYRRWTPFLVLANMVLLAALYLTLVSPAFMPDDILNPAYVNFMTSAEYKQSVPPLFDALQTYENDPIRQRPPTEQLLASDPTQFGIVVHVEYRLAQQDASSDGSRHYRYDTHVRVRVALGTLAGFIGVEILIGLLAFVLSRKGEPVLVEFEEEVLRGYFFPQESESADTPAAHGALLHLLDRFHAYAKELQAQRRAGRIAWQIDDEYDVQHALCALLRAHFDNVKPEETTPSLAGSSSRMDFLLVNERTGIETKMMRESLDDRKLGAQLLLDVAHFPSHSQCESLIFLVHDPCYAIRNPAGLRDEVIAAAGGFPVEIVYSPPR